MDQRPETAAERAARWEAESAHAKPRSRVREASGELVPRLLGGLVVLALFGTITYVGINIAHRGDPGGTQNAGWITPGTCFSSDPGDDFTGTQPVGALPTVTCSTAHRAEAFTSFNLTPGQESSATAACDRDWSKDSHVPVSVSGIYVTTLVKSTPGSLPEQAVCVAVAPQPVTGLQLTTWQPSGSPTVSS